MNANHRYFAAANTAEGFYSQFPMLFDPGSGELNKLYILKGGPGTGKSGFMKRIADAAETRGMEVWRYYCSSDTNSLDGIRIPACGVAVLDGTSPHTVDPVYPGVVEEIINLGMFFDPGKLREHTDEIKAICAANASHHRRAGRYLRAAGEARMIRRGLSLDAFEREKAMRAMRRYVRMCLPEKEETITRENCITTANSTQGRIHFTTGETSASRCIYVTDKRGLAAPVLETLIAAAEERGISYVRYADPLFFGETEGVCLPGCDMVWYSDRYLAKKADVTPLNAARFYDTERLSPTREKRNFAEKCEDALLDGAYESLAAAGQTHDALERYYIAAMDFSALEAFTERLIKTVFA